jgi:glutamine amidotransferase
MIAIVKYKAGNIRSVSTALDRLGFRSVITDNESDLLNADKVILPGVGEAGTAMKSLKENGLDRLICSLKMPVLGICLGLQLLCRYSEESATTCLGIFDSAIRKFPPEDKVPHMGWDNFLWCGGKIFNGIEAKDNLYYVHSYYAELSEHTIAVCDYILPFSAAMQKDNFFATQFHPEKSGDVGAKIFENFLKL